MRQTVLGSFRSIVGVALIGLGLFLLGGNLSDVAARLSGLVGFNSDATQSFGELTAFGLAAAQVWRSYVFDRRELVLDVCRILISFWPMLLVIAGTVLTGIASRTESRNLHEKIQELSK
jgi:ascorbate-specific PTS system EIIC-type component UlaA